MRFFFALKGKSGRWRPFAGTLQKPEDINVKDGNANRGACQSPSHSPSAPRTQEERILWALQAAYPSWTPAPVLSRISLQYNSRVLGLRRKGWQIENRVEVRDGKKHGYFRLATPGSLPNPKKKRTLETAGGPKSKTDWTTPETTLFPTNTPACWADPEEQGHR